MSDIRYVFDDFVVELGRTHPDIDHWLQMYQKDRWVIITAENPNGEEFPFFVNKQRTGVLRNRLQSNSHFYVEGKTKLDGYPEEICFLVLGLGLQEATNLAKEFDQLAFVTAVPQGFSEIIHLGGE